MLYNIFVHSYHFIIPVGCLALICRWVLRRTPLVPFTNLYNIIYNLYNICFIINSKVPKHFKKTFSGFTTFVTTKFPINKNRHANIKSIFTSYIVDYKCYEIIWQMISLVTTKSRIYEVPKMFLKDHWKGTWNSSLKLDPSKVK